MQRVGQSVGNKAEEEASEREGKAQGLNTVCCQCRTLHQDKHLQGKRRGLLPSSEIVPNNLC